MIEENKTEASNVKITNGYLESILKTTQNGIELRSEDFQNVLKKPLPVKVSYWLARAVDKISREARVYFKSRQDLVEKHAERHEEDGKEMDPKDTEKVLREWKKDDIVVTPAGGVEFGENQEKFLEDLVELQSIEFDLGIYPIKIDLDNFPDLSTVEISVILPLIKVQE